MAANTYLCSHNDITMRLLLSFAFLFSLFVPCLAGTHWLIEAESAQTRIVLRDDTLDITSPQGLSLWWDQPLKAPCTVEYRACVVMEGGSCDRLSDLNCFWMASEPFTGMTKRGGRFAESYRLQCYYLGYGGNHNTTTRFRRYDGDTLAVADATRRPPILKEYTDATHQLKPNHWYAVRIEMQADGRTRYFIDNELLVDYLDPTPLLHGWFAFRTTWSHTRLTAFKITPLHHSSIIIHQSSIIIPPLPLGEAGSGPIHHFFQIMGEALREDS